MSGSVLITGANGFVGRALVAALARAGWRLRAAVRDDSARREVEGLGLADVECVAVGDIGPTTDWSRALDSVEVVVHLAARVHVMREVAADPLAEFRRVNVAGTANLARQAAAAGARRIVFLSSIKVNGEETMPGKPFLASDPPRPCDPYGISKQEAEEALQDIAARSALRFTVIRPVLVYGPGVKGNFRAMMSVLARGIPLPLGSVRNFRSLVGVDNLADLIRVSLNHAGAENGTFLVSDGEDLSTPRLLELLGEALGRPARLLPLPPRVLLALAGLLGKRAAASRVCGSLQVDISAARTLLGWVPPVGVADGLRRAADEYVRSGQGA